MLEIQLHVILPKKPKYILFIQHKQQKQKQNETNRLFLILLNI